MLMQFIQLPLLFFSRSVPGVNVFFYQELDQQL